MTTSSETSFFVFPTEISTDRIRVCRDHVAKAKVELGFLLNKLPEIQKKSFGHIQYGDQCLTLDSTDVISLVTQLLSFIDTEYELRRKVDKAEKKKEKKKNHLTVMDGGRSRNTGRFTADDMMLVNGVVCTADDWYTRNIFTDSQKKHQVTKIHARILKRKPIKQLLTDIEDQ